MPLKISAITHIEAIYAFQGRSPQWNGEMTCFCNSSPKPALRFDHQPCLLIVADFLRGDGRG